MRSFINFLFREFNLSVDFHPRDHLSAWEGGKKEKRVILVNMVISVILGHEKTKIQNIIDLEMIDVFSVKTIIHSNNKKMGHLI